MEERSSTNDPNLRTRALPSLSTSRPSTAPHSGSATGEKLKKPNPYNEAAEHNKQSPETSHSHQRFVLTDPVAFRYLEEDPSTVVLERRRELQGYECYIVEQWATSRTHPTFVITTYSGDPSHVVFVGVLSVPTDESVWSTRLRVYFKALNQYHARRRDTPLGILMLTNLSGFPSALTVVPVPGGDLKKYRVGFFLNENLKRLGCSGRVGLTLLQPATATVAKFHQLYRTSDKNEIYQSVSQLVILCQTALVLFDKLQIDYADGLLCDVTERAINDWWADIGTDQYNIEPHDGILGPTTVAGLLGLLLGARNRLHSVNTSIPKDPFDTDGMKRAIGAFQKQQRLPRTRRFDRRTLDRLHKVTQKVADKERWAVPRAVKSTVAELSGKGGEMMMEAVGRRDKAGIAEIETVEMDRFEQLVYGDRCKWLWLGKPMKRTKGHETQEGAPTEADAPSNLNNNLIFKSDEHGGFTWTTGRKSIPDALLGSRRFRDLPSDQSAQTLGYETEDNTDAASAKASGAKRTDTLKSEAKSGIDKVKGVVGFRGHKAKPSIDDAAPVSPIQNKQNKMPLLRRTQTSPSAGPNSPPSRVASNRSDVAAAADQTNRLHLAIAQGDDKSTMNGDFVSSPQEMSEPFTDGDQRWKTRNLGDSMDKQSTVNGEDSRRPSKDDRADTSIPSSIYNESYLSERPPSVAAKREMDVSLLLKRSTSYDPYTVASVPNSPHDGFSRHLSFALAESSVLHWDSPGQYDQSSDHKELKDQLAEEEFFAQESKHLRLLIQSLNSGTATWTLEQLRELRTLLEQLNHDHDVLNSLHYPYLESAQALQSQSESALREGKESLEEAAREIETLAAKLEYEMNGLRSKVEDVEAGVDEFEQGVSRMEERVLELQKQGDKRTGWSCTVS